MPDPKIDEFRSDVLARATAIAPGAQAAPPDGHRIKSALHGLDGVVQKLRPLILIATPDQYDSIVELAAAALHGLAGGEAAAPAA